MLKRKAAVNDIIYELDNDDIEISSDDEAKEAKIHRSDKNAKEKPSRKKTDSEETCVEVVNLDSTIEGEAEVEIQTCVQNGGKTSPNIEVVDSVGKETVELETEERSKMEAENQTDIISDSNRTIYNEDIIIDSPTSNSDLGVVGCENRTPLVTIKFKDKNFAKRYKEEVKLFMLKLIKLHEEDSQVDSDSITDLEVDIWPEDLTEDDTDDVKEEVVEDSLFFVDTDPSMRGQNVDVPTYRQNTSLISDTPDKEQSPPRVLRRGPTCFNCDGAHALRDCPLPRNNQKIAENRKNMAVKVGRYHVEDDQKYGHLVPGRISGNLRHALGLKRNELPLYIYRMRMLGYPPGWLEEARISHSGISMFDSSGQAILDPEDEEGELCEPGSKDKFDIKKILDFPGFNVPASSRYTEEAHQYGLPPLSDQDSKLAMLQMLAPNAMKAYKRKKLTLMPSASANNTLEGQAEMDIDSGDEAAAFPSVPPLPDEAPPPAPPPPPPPPEDECEGDKSADDKSDLEVIEVIKVPDIPVPEDELITIDDDISSDRSSPSLRDLEETKRRLMSALENSDVSTLEDEDRVQQPESKEEMSKEPVSEERTSQEQMSEEDKSQEEQSNNQTPNDQNESVVESTVNSQESSVVSEKDPETRSQSDSDIEPKTPKTGAVKTTDYGTPIMNIASSYTKLPSDEKFSKNISDVINFENLPNSTGKYKQISVLLRKVKDEVDRIQES